MQLEETPDEILEAEPPRDEEPTHSLPYVLGHLCREISGRSINSVQLSRMEQNPRATLVQLMGVHFKTLNRERALDRTVSRVFEHLDLEEFSALVRMDLAQKNQFMLGYQHPLDKLVQA